MNMDFGTNKTPDEVIQESAFRGTYFRNIYSGVNGKWLNGIAFRKSWKKFNEFKNIDQNYYVNVNKSGANCRISLRFEKIKVTLIL